MTETAKRAYSPSLVAAFVVSLVCYLGLFGYAVQSIPEAYRPLFTLDYLVFGTLKEYISSIAFAIFIAFLFNKTSRFRGLSAANIAMSFIILYHVLMSAMFALRIFVP